jgi:hypothetical protein
MLTRNILGALADVYQWLRRNWSLATTLQTGAFLVTAIFTALLWQVTSEYTQFTQQIFQSQHEKYIYDVLGNRAFEVEILPRLPIQDVRGLRLQLRIKNLTTLRFDRVRLQVFARLHDRRAGQSSGIFVFEPFVEGPLYGDGLIQLEDTQNDVAFHLSQAGALTRNGGLDPRLEITTFFASVEALSPGGVLWRLTTDTRR